MKKILPVLMGLIAFFLFSSFSHSGQADKKAAKRVRSAKVSFKLTWHHGVQFLGYYVAQAKGYYDREGLEVTLFEISDSRETSRIPFDVAAGKYDMGTDSGALVYAQRQGEALTALAAIYQYPPQTLFARADSGIVQLADIAGHTVVIKSLSWRTLIKESLALEGLTMDDIVEVKGGFDMIPFYEGKVDVWAGFLTNEVARARLKGLKLVTFPFYEYSFTGLGNSIFASKEYLADHQSQVVRFLRASIKGWTWAVDNPSAAIDIFLRKFPRMARERDFHLASFMASIPLIRPPGVRVGSIDCQTYVLNLKVDEKKPAQLCSDRFLKAALRGMN